MENRRYSAIKGNVSVSTLQIFSFLKTYRNKKGIIYVRISGGIITMKILILITRFLKGVKPTMNLLLFAAMMFLAYI